MQESGRQEVQGYVLSEYITFHGASSGSKNSFYQEIYVFKYISLLKFVLEYHKQYLAEIQNSNKYIFYCFITNIVSSNS